MSSLPEPLPALPPPPGQSSDFNSADPFRKWDIVCVTTCVGVTTIFFVLRTWVRFVVKKQWILEDFMCCISYLGLIGFCALETITMSKGGGIHEWNLTVSQVQTITHWFNLTTIEYAPSIMCTKLTVLLLYRRVFLPHRWSTFDIIIRGFIAIITIYYMTTIILKTCECVPRARIWDKSIEGTCINVSTILNTDGVFNTITDFIILLVPVKALWKLQMKRRKKIAVLLLFTVGLIAPIFSIVGWVVRLQNSAKPDGTYGELEILLWATAELSAGVICTCLPTLPTLVRGRQIRTPGTPAAASSTRLRRGRLFSIKQPSILGGLDSFDGEYLELWEGNMPSGRTELGPKAMITDIKGGTRRNRPEEVGQKRGREGILRVVDIEQSSLRSL